MRYAKAAAVGGLWAFATAALYLFLKEAFAALYISLVLVPRAQTSAGSGSWDASYPMLVDVRGPLVVGFVAGCWWTLRRRQVRSPN
jgi:hypothetical protein